MIAGFGSFLFNYVMKSFGKENLIVGLLIFLFGFSVIATIFVDAATEKDASSFGNFSPKVSFNKDAIGLIELYGPIGFSAPTLLSPTGDDAILDQIQAMEEDTSIKGILVRINSPGGTVGASQEIFEALNRYRENTNYPVVVSIADLCASGGYYVALGADTIFANPGSLIGSIGVLISTLDLTDVPDKYGIDVKLYKSVPYKDILSSWRDATVDEDEMIQALLEDVHSQFLAALVASRDLDVDYASSLAKGQIFSGNQAKDRQLIDLLGSFEDALMHIGNEAGIPGRPELVRKTDYPFTDFLQTFAAQFSTRLDPLNWVSPVAVQ